MSITATQSIAWQIDSDTPLLGQQDVTWAINTLTSSIRSSQAFSWAIGATADTIQVVLTGAPTGLLGILTVSIIMFDGSDTFYFPTAQGIEEVPTGTGRYVATVLRPPVGKYFVVWSDGATTTQAELLVLFDNLVQTPIRVTGLSEYRIKAGDTQPGLILTVRNAGGAPVDLTEALGVNAKVKRKGDPAPLVDRSFAVLDPATDGQILLNWEDGDTDLAGVYIAECGLLWPGNGRSTAPSRATYRFVIEEAGIS